MITNLQNKRGERLDHTYHHGRQGGRELVVIGHGVTGNKDRPFLLALAEGLAKAGISALRVSFSGNGSSGGQFSECTITKEVEDLGAILDSIADRNVIYAGHSMGAAVGVLRAAMDPRIKGLISLAGMVHTAAFYDREFGAIKPGEGLMWDKPDCPLSDKYAADMRTIGSVLKEASRIRVPWLLVHGTEDDVVPIQDSKDIFAHANQPREIIELSGANHLFEGDHTEALIQAVVPWIQGHFH